ncbi:acyl-phosphate glycerol 3-phosphate acyltransferase [Vulcanibacillus modesticaldus]|uniref:Glycerol-3-phosphate acyltransferase n=1 Tax=Vulcanibacillus modesticaldus TaxID=337097 RepID=A0A1D2YWE8_9BACI|nr:acyl-phosphate glycerol 3-phosphate acyltransferase [Vulcanibacillus modesticaldus]
MEVLTAIIISYLIGSLSFAYIIGKIFYKIDIRNHGSKNLGGSNAGRVLGKKVGISVIILDFFKGYLAVWLVANIFESNFEISIISGLFVVLGHLFPIFFGFKGGKGVATSGGVMLFINPWLILISVLIILILWLITGYESLSTLIAFAFVLFVLLSLKSTLISIFSIIVFVGILYAYRNNIRSLLNGTEKKKNIFNRFK